MKALELERGSVFSIDGGENWLVAIAEPRDGDNDNVLVWEPDPDALNRGDEFLPEILNEFLERENLKRTEGTTGVRNLCKLARALGYKDFQNFGQFEGACYGDLICFLEDNPGAVESIVEWISEQGGNDEWEENLKSE